MKQLKTPLLAYFNERTGIVGRARTKAAQAPINQVTDDLLGIILSFLGGHEINKYKIALMPQAGLSNDQIQAGTLYLSENTLRKVLMYTVNTGKRIIRDEIILGPCGNVPEGGLTAESIKHINQKWILEIALNEGHTPPINPIHPVRAQINACIALQRYNPHLLNPLAFANNSEFTQIFTLTRRCFQNPFYLALQSYNQRMEEAMKEYACDISSAEKVSRAEFLTTLLNGIQKKREITTIFNPWREIPVRIAALINLFLQNNPRLGAALLMFFILIQCLNLMVVILGCIMTMMIPKVVGFVALAVATVVSAAPCLYVAIMNLPLSQPPLPAKPDVNTIKISELILRFGAGAQRNGILKNTDVNAAANAAPRVVIGYGI